VAIIKAPPRSAVENGAAMLINRERIAGILAVGMLLNFAINIVAYRAAVCVLCPEPAVTLESFDRLRDRMRQQEAIAFLESPCIDRICQCEAPPQQGRQVLHFRQKDIAIALLIEDGLLREGTATLNGQVVRHHLEPRDPILDTLRQGLRRLERQ
jgi:hypothetical protein